MSLSGQWSSSGKQPVRREQAVRRGRIPWIPGAVAERPPMSPEYREALATRLAATALLDLDTARRHVEQLGIDPIPAHRVHRPRERS
jgi:hypothetical protein